VGNCSWRAVEFGPHSFGIERAENNALVGAIDLIEARWHVEVLSSGFAGNIKADFADYPSAVAFVDAAFARMPA
jgi:hypothetical protein